MSASPHYPHPLVLAWRLAVRPHKRPQIGERVHLIGTRISGVVVQACPLVVRDGYGVEHETAAFAVRGCK